MACPCSQPTPPVEESQGTTNGSEVDAPSTSLTIFVPNLLGDSDSEAGNTPRNPILCGEISAPGSPGISGRSLGPEPSPLVASPLPLVPLAPVGPGGETPRDTDGVVSEVDSSRHATFAKVSHPSGEGTGGRPMGDFVREKVEYFTPPQGSPSARSS